MLKGGKIDLVLVASKDECIQWADLYNNVEERDESDHTEIVSAKTIQERYEQNGLWSSGAGAFLVKSKTGDILGEVSFKSSDTFEATLGYRLFEKTSRRKGYMTEALTLFCEYLFEMLPINRIALRMCADNTGSQKVAEKIGFKLEGTLRKAYFYRGRFVDFLMYGLLREEVSL